MNPPTRVKSPYGCVQNMQRRVEFMEPRADCFVSGALAVVLRVSRFAGAAPLNFVKKTTRWRVSVSRGWSVYGYIVMTVMILMTFGTMLFDLQVEQKQSVRMRTNTRRVVWIADSSIMMLIAGTVVYGAPGQMRSMIGYLSQLQKINHELNIHQLPWYGERKKIFWFVFWMIVTVSITTIDYVMLNSTINGIYDQTWINVMYMFYYPFYWIMLLLMMKFVMVAMHLLYSFRTINGNLRDLMFAVSDFENLSLMVPSKTVCKKYKKSYNNIVVSSIAALKKTNTVGVAKESNSQHDTVRRLSLMYAATCDVVREVDRCSGPVLLLILGGFLLHLVCTPYYFINNIFQDKTSQTLATHVINLILQLFWCIFHLANLVMIIEPCHLTHAEMENTRELVGHLMRYSNSTYDPLAAELELFFRHLILNQASYSPMKVTTMSRALVATILGSITTYLVVIAQL